MTADLRITVEAEDMAQVDHRNFGGEFKNTVGLDEETYKLERSAALRNGERKGEGGGKRMGEARR